MHLFTDYVTAEVNGYHVRSISHSALPNAPVVPDPERDPFVSRLRRRIAGAARIFAVSPPPAPSNEITQAQA